MLLMKTGVVWGVVCCVGDMVVVRWDAFIVPLSAVKWCVDNASSTKSEIKIYKSRIKYNRK